MPSVLSSVLAFTTIANGATVEVEELNDCASPAVTFDDHTATFASNGCNVSYVDGKLNFEKGTEVPAPVDVTSGLTIDVKGVALALKGSNITVPANLVIRATGDGAAVSMPDGSNTHVEVIGTAHLEATDGATFDFEANKITVQQALTVKAEGATMNFKSAQITSGSLEVDATKSSDINGDSSNWSSDRAANMRFTSSKFKGQGSTWFFPSMDLKVEQTKMEMGERSTFTVKDFTVDVKDGTVDIPNANFTADTKAKITLTGESKFNVDGAIFRTNNLDILMENASQLSNGGSWKSVAEKPNCTCTTKEACEADLGHLLMDQCFDKKFVDERNKNEEYKKEREQATKKAHADSGSAVMAISVLAVVMLS